MKNLILPVLLIFLSITTPAQHSSTGDYFDFRQSVRGITNFQLESMYPRSSDHYYKGFDNGFTPGGVHYLDSVVLKLGLTADEQELLRQNRFFVTERLSYHNFGQAFHTVYNHDLPVFVTTDAVLHALHMSYDQILKTLERGVMAHNLEEFLKSLYDDFGLLVRKYGESEELAESLKDADIYVTIAWSLISGELREGHIADPQKIREVWEAIKSEKMVSMPLFTYPYRTRKLDFSQFTVRGHYVYTQEDMWMGLKSLEPYFRAMMWLGRTDFFLTKPADNPWEEPYRDEEIMRMQQGAFMVNELVQHSDVRDKLRFNEKVIDFLVGASDNITPEEFQSVLNKKGIAGAEQLTDTAVFQELRDALNSDPELGQKILSDFFFMDPFSDEPGELPISYRLSGQRFIIDSYVLGNLVFDRLIHNGEKVMRMMPKPMDILFPLGNNDVLPLLEDEFKKYPYAEQLANLRYLIDNKPEEFWSGSLYNVWLNSIRELNPPDDESGFPLFMRSAAWHQQKMNTQLASWSQLRHDNLLYAKQSYTGGTGCSFPHSYVEPYPGFYARLGEFAGNAGSFFGQLATTDPELRRIVEFFPRFESIMEKLAALAEKQLNGTAFSEEEAGWLQGMLFATGGSGMPPYTGWYADLFFDKWDAAEGDFTVVDVHTQPTDEAGNVVGKVLHTGTGYVNLGVFVAPCPTAANQLMAFAGPVMSYYEKTTDRFKRMTDQEWEELVHDNALPQRPGWTNIYLAGQKGEAKAAGIELPSKLYTGAIPIEADEMALSAYPNPVRDVLTLSFAPTRESRAEIAVYTSTGVLVHNTTAGLVNGKNLVRISFKNLPEGLYITRVTTRDGRSRSLKIIKK